MTFLKDGKREKNVALDSIAQMRDLAMMVQQNFRYMLSAICQCRKKCHHVHTGKRMREIN